MTKSYAPRAPSAAAAGIVPLGEFRGNRLDFGAMRLTQRDIWGESAVVEECRRVLRE